MQNLSTMHGNKKVLLDRIQLNLYLSFLGPKDFRMDITNKILDRALSIEKESNSPWMHVPAKLSEVRKLYSDGFPSDYITIC